MKAIGSWARYLGLGTQAEADDQQFWITETGDERSWIQAFRSWVRYLGLGTQAEADDQQSWISKAILSGEVRTLPSQALFGEKRTENHKNIRLSE